MLSWGQAHGEKLWKSYFLSSWGWPKLYVGMFILSAEVNQSWANSKKKKGQRKRNCKIFIQRINIHGTFEGPLTALKLWF